VEWKDITTYSRDDKKRIPEILETKLDNFNIRIHRHIHYPDTWLLSCHQLAMQCIDLKTDDFNIAEISAINFLIRKLDEYVKLQALLVELNRKAVGLPV
jgi:hypothetical protein